MTEVSNDPLSRFAQVVSRSAPALAAHVVRTAQAALEKDAQMPGVSPCLLLMKVAAADVVREFAAGLQQASQPAHAQDGREPGFGALDAFALEPLGTDDPTAETMQRSSEKFAQLLAACRARGVEGFEIYGKGFFVAPLRQSFATARVDDATAERIMPYACVALDAALLRVYAEAEKIAL